MKSSGLLMACAAIALLSGCGSDGTSGTGLNTGVTPPPSPPSPPPPPPNTVITDLKASQTFSGPSASTTVLFDTAKGITVNGSTKPTSVDVAYDAATKTYTVTTSGRSQTFLPAEAVSTAPGETRYTKTGGSDLLTLAISPYNGGPANNYVAMAYWQHNAISGSQQNTNFDIFAYGIDTPSAAIPRTGAAAFRTDIFGLLTTPGVEPRGLQGAGSFTADFLSGLFSASAILQEYDYVTHGGQVGGLHFESRGQISSSGNGFSGNVAYDNGNFAVAGTLSGKFYGPAADEIGASFSASDGKGSALSGALTGQRDANTTLANLALTNILSTERVKSWLAGTWTAQYDGASDFFDLRSANADGFVTLRPGAPPAVDTGSSLYPFVDLTAADGVTSTHANFDAYDKTVAGSPVHIELYKPGPANTELALSYASFGTWRSSSREATTTGSLTRENHFFFLYGLETPRGLLGARTGSGRYDGIVSANGASPDGHFYDIGGTSRFDVDFSNLKYSGALTLNALNGPSFGTWTFGSTLNAGQMLQAAFKEDPGGSIQPRFYGPDGQEIGATFRLTSGAAGSPAAVSISGVALAKKAP